MIGGSGRINIDLMFGLDRLPCLGEERYAENFSMAFGGGVPGTLLLLHRMGVPVRLITAGGEDLYSRFAKEYLAESGMAPVWRNKGENAPCNLSVAMLTAGERTFVSFGESAPIEWSVSDFADCDFILMERRHAAEYRALKGMGKTLLCDLGDLSCIPSEEKDELLNLADYWFPNRKEWQSESNETDCRRAAERLRKKMKCGVLKLDREGAYWYTPDGEGYVPAVPAAYCDSLGAGDAFLAGFLYGLEKGYDMQKCTELGCLTGAKCVSGRGCHGAYYTEEQMEKFCSAEK